MGNPAVGNAVGPQAEAELRCRVPGESALDILDRLCDRWRNTDAEWESTDPDNPTQVHPEFESWTDPHPKAALGMLMLEAFAPNGVEDLARYAPVLGVPCDATEAEQEDGDAGVNAWWEEVYTPFKQRYNFW